MKGALAVMLMVAARPPRPGGGAAATRHRLRRGVRGGGEPRLGCARRQAGSSATSRSPASRPTSRSGCRRRAFWRCGSRSRAVGARGHAVARGQRRRQGGRGIQGHRIATVCTPQLRPVRPPLDQSRSDRGRRRPEQSARYLRHRRRYPLPARPGSRRDPGAGERPARHRGGRHLRRAPAVVEPDSPFVQGLCEAASPHHPERVMSVGRDGASDAVSFLARRRARGRVRPDRRRPPRPGGVGLDLLAAQLPAGARGLREELPGDGRREPGARGRERAAARRDSARTRAAPGRDDAGDAAFNVERRAPRRAGDRGRASPRDEEPRDERHDEDTDQATSRRPRASGEDDDADVDQDEGDEGRQGAGLAEEDEARTAWSPRRPRSGRASRQPRRRPSEPTASRRRARRSPRASRRSASATITSGFRVVREHVRFPSGCAS